MNPELTPIARCEEIAGLEPHELVLGVSPGRKHERLLAAYRRGRRSPTVARVRIVADIREAVAHGAASRAADLLIVLRRLLATHSGPRLASPARRSMALPHGAYRSGTGARLRRADLPSEERESVTRRFWWNFGNGKLPRA